MMDTNNKIVGEVMNRHKETFQFKLLYFIIIIASVITMSACNMFEDSPQDDTGLLDHNAPDHTESTDAQHSNSGDTSTDEDIQTNEDTVEEPTFPDPVTIKISAVGDVMLHSPQINAAYDSEKGKYDFNHNFTYIKPYIERSDLAIANFESTFGGSERGYSGFPMFNVPDEMAKALNNAGFDVIATSNNHTLDTGKNGVFRTIDVLQQNNLDVIGTRKDEDSAAYVVKDVQGIQVGLTAWTYETPRHGDNKTLNGIIMPKDMEPLIDSFSYQHLDEDLKRMEQRVQQLRDEGAEVIIFYMHWGDEYSRQPNDYQEQIAQALANFGVDIVFGSHPHVIQTIEMIASEVDDHETVVVYSMGNFISNQRGHLVTSGRGFTEDGIIVNINVTKNYETDTISIDEVTYVPTWVHLYDTNARRVYEILPAADVFANDEILQFNLSNSAYERIRKSKDDTVSIIEDRLRKGNVASELTDEELELFLNE